MDQYGLGQEDMEDVYIDDFDDSQSVCSALGSLSVAELGRGAGNTLNRSDGSGVGESESDLVGGDSASLPSEGQDLWELASETLPPSPSSANSCKEGSGSSEGAVKMPSSADHLLPTSPQMDACCASFSQTASEAAHSVPERAIHLHTSDAKLTFPPCRNEGGLTSSSHGAGVLRAQAPSGAVKREERQEDLLGEEGMGGFPTLESSSLSSIDSGQRWLRSNQEKLIVSEQHTDINLPHNRGTKEPYMPQDPLVGFSELPEGFQEVSQHSVEPSREALHPMQPPVPSCSSPQPTHLVDQQQQHTFSPLKFLDKQQKQMRDLSQLFLPPHGKGVNHMTGSSMDRTCVVGSSPGLGTPHVTGGNPSTGLSKHIMDVNQSTTLTTRASDGNPAAGLAKHVTYGNLDASVAMLPTTGWPSGGRTSQATGGNPTAGLAKHVTYGNLGPSVAKLPPAGQPSGGQTSQANGGNPTAGLTKHVTYGNLDGSVAMLPPAGQPSGGLTTKATDGNPNAAVGNPSAAPTTLVTKGNQSVPSTTLVKNGNTGAALTKFVTEGNQSVIPTVTEGNPNVPSTSLVTDGNPGNDGNTNALSASLVADGNASAAPAAHASDGNPSAISATIVSKGNPSPALTAPGTDGNQIHAFAALLSDGSPSAQAPTNDINERISAAVTDRVSDGRPKAPIVRDVDPKTPPVVSQKNVSTRQITPPCQPLAIPDADKVHSLGACEDQTLCDEGAVSGSLQSWSSQPRETSYVPQSPIDAQSWTEARIGQKIFQNTSTLEEATELLFESDCSRVLLCGPPGSGKRMLGRALLRQASDDGFPCLVINTLHEWRDCVGNLQTMERSEGGGTTFVPQILLLNHVFGRGLMIEKELDSWRRVFEVMLAFCKEGRVKLVFTFYPHILLRLREALPGCELLTQLCEVPVGCLDKDEKTQMLRAHLDHRVHKRNLRSVENTDRAIGSDWKEGLIDFVLQIDESAALFPGCCQRLADGVSVFVPDPETGISNFKHHLESVAKFFSRPSPVYKEFVAELLNTSDQLKELLMAAFCLLLANRDVQDVAATADMCRRCGFSSACSSVPLRETLSQFRNIVVNEECSQFVNRHAYEGVALAIGQHNPSIIVQEADWPFVIKRCVVQGMDVQITHSPFLLRMRRLTKDKTKVCREYKALVHRIAHGMKDPGTMMAALQHPVLSFRTFVDDMGQELGDNLPSILTETQDSVYGATVLFWSLFTSPSFCSVWIFKTAVKRGGQFSVEDLILVVSACCVMDGKAEFLSKLLQYWPMVAKEKVENLLFGHYLQSCSTPIAMPVPKADMCISQSWQSQLKYLHKQLKTLPVSLRAMINVVHQPFNDAGGRVTSNVASLHPAASTAVSPFTSQQRPLTSCAQSTQQTRKLDKARKGREKCVDISHPLLHLAVMYNNMPVVRMLKEKYPGTLTVTNPQGKTALHIAARCGHLDMVDLLVQVQGLTTKLDEQGNNAMHDACCAHHMDVAMRLVDVDGRMGEVQNHSGCTPQDLLMEEEEDNTDAE